MKIGESVQKAKSNWAWIALFLWILWVSASLQKMERDIAHVSDQTAVVSSQVEKQATSDELEDLKSTVDDIETTVQNIRQ